MIIQLCGLSGAGKSTIAEMVRKRLLHNNIETEIIDGDEYRKVLCRDLGFSKADRCENIRRLGFVASKLSAHGVVVIVSAINPYHEIRSELSRSYKGVHTVYIDCSIPALIRRDTKGLYKKALLPDTHPEKIFNLTGINDPFEAPLNPDLHIRTSSRNQDDCANELFSFITHHVSVSTPTQFTFGRVAM